MQANEVAMDERGFGDLSDYLGVFPFLLSKNERLNDDREWRGMGSSNERMAKE